MSWTPVRLNNGGTYPHGFGWNIVEQRGYRRIGHSGAWLGNHATLQRYPDFNLTVIVLLNLGQANSEGIAVGIAGLIEPALTPPHLLATPLKGATPPTPIDRLLARAEGSGMKKQAAAAEAANSTRPPGKRTVKSGLSERGELERAFPESSRDFTRPGRDFTSPDRGLTMGDRTEP